MKRRASQIDISISSRTFALDKLKPTESALRVELDTAILRARCRWLLDLLTEIPVTLSLRLTDADEIRQLNREFRHKDKPTDVLSFPAMPEPWEIAESPKPLGDIVICIPVCYFQARRYRRTFAEEVERMLVHGLTHLLGLDHERSDAAFRVQNALERRLRDEIVRHFGKPAWIAEAQRPRRDKRRH